MDIGLRDPAIAGGDGPTRRTASPGDSKGVPGVTPGNLRVSPGANTLLPTAGVAGTISTGVGRDLGVDESEGEMTLTGMCGACGGELLVCEGVRRVKGEWPSPWAAVP